VIAGQALLRNTINKGCGSTRSDAGSLAQSSLTPSFKTKAEEDDANDRAITQALYELMEEEETAKLHGTFKAAPATGGLAWSRDQGLYDPSTEPRRAPTEEEQMKWAMEESARASRDSPGPMASGALPPESLISPVKPLHAPSKSPRSTTSQPTKSSVVSSVPPSTIISPVSPLYSSSRSAYSAKEGQSRAASAIAPSPVSPLFHESDTAPPKRKASTVVAPHMPPPSSRRSEPPLSSPIAPIDISEPFNPDQWTCSICTCINPVRYLACDACGIERPQPQKQTSSRNQSQSRSVRPASSEVSSMRSSVTPSTRYGSNGLPLSSRRSDVSSLSSSSSSYAPRTRQRESVGWGCSRCGAYMEHKWWTCSACGMLKDSS
jgi:hypothetical protein